MEFHERCETLVVNLYGCAVRAGSTLPRGTPVQLQVNGNVIIGRVVDVVSIAEHENLWMLGIALDCPGNFWGIQNPPKDWDSIAEAAPGQASPDTSDEQSQESSNAEKLTIWPSAFGPAAQRTAAPSPREPQTPSRDSQEDEFRATEPNVGKIGSGQSQLDSSRAIEAGLPASRHGSLASSDQNSVIIALEQRITSEALPLDAALDLVAENAQRLLNGSGAAIALPESDEMVCCASAGRAPGIGVQFRAETGLTGEAVRSGRVVTCHNTLCDPRVDSKVWRKVGIRSAVSVPIPLSEGGTGVLEVFAAQSNAFTSAHGILLEALSGLVGRVVASTSRNLSGGSRPATRSTEGA